MSVPIQNVYYLLCYAWNRLEARELVDVGAVPGDRVQNLLAQVLIVGAARLIRTGFDRDYTSVHEESRSLRGKLLLSQTVKRTLLPRGQVACEFDELSHDVPHNRVLKAAMRELGEVPELDEGLRRALRRARARLHDVSDIDLDPAAFREVRLHRNIARYAFLMNVCELVARCLLPESTTGRRHFHAFTEQPQIMGLLFQDFVRNFLAREQSAFAVSAPEVPWQAQPLDDSDLGWLPTMRTDMALTRPDRRVVIETKYSASPVQSHYETRKLISAHLYQLLAYVTHLRATPGPEPIGVLLYAMSGEQLDLGYRLGGHRVLVRTLDLDQPWPLIHRDLLARAGELEALEDREAAIP